MPHSQTMETLVWHSPRHHEWLLPDMLSDGNAHQTRPPNAPHLQIFGRAGNIWSGWRTYWKMFGIQFKVCLLSTNSQFLVDFINSDNKFTIFGSNFPNYFGIIMAFSQLLIRDRVTYLS